MAKSNKKSSEFERELVPENKLKSWKSFLGCMPVNTQQGQNL